MRVLIIGLLSLVALGAGVFYEEVEKENAVLKSQRLMKANQVLLNALREISSETETQVGDWSASKQYVRGEHTVHNGYYWTCENQVCETYAPGEISYTYWRRGGPFSGESSGVRGPPVQEGEAQVNEDAEIQVGVRWSKSQRYLRGARTTHNGYYWRCLRWTCQSAEPGKVSYGYWRQEGRASGWGGRGEAQVGFAGQRHYVNEAAVGDHA